ncbi:zf-TFIIB domain-containing protein [Pseudenhygromyxa sp. WMMC2535]|uniref:TFIIB-type zinc ribbon-containing protein n=1 Tax=Pseudenhygromyxa sp. WMMC2535 TaxID=2712867 RepID=UPI00155457EF|nr:zf-TFIIB domain-containing protein [Pseudenhygromyxa sp. WMMC2535]NVB40774.1 zf-TFIIB domain-containing protein [Pseudenhygromyxa sp. WMMC2535]
MSSETEDEYILRQEMQKKREAVRKRQAELAEEEKAKLKEIHWMHCAKCGAELHEVEFRGVKIDKCFSCGGVYLDDGELEQLAGRPGWFDSMVHIFRG